MIATLVLALAQSAPTDIAAYLQKDFRDASFTVKIVRKNQTALESINKDFGRSFQFDTTAVRMKEPYKLRLDTKEEDTQISYILNGTTQRFKIAKLPFLNKPRDLSKLPASRQTTLDFGFLVPSLFGELFDAKYVQTDAAKGAAEFDLTYKPVYENTSHHRVWLDPATHTVVRREWYNRQGRLLATFEYSAPKDEGGTTMPTRMVVRDPAGEIAGETRLDDVRINQGIEDSVFSG